MIRPPLLLRALYPGVIWSKPEKEKVLYLTFDDGPTPGVTDKVLDLLRIANAKATFFCIGQNVQLYPEIYHRILEDGHCSGNHTWSHPDCWKVSSSNYIRDTEKASMLIKSKLFRPPYGKLTPSVMRTLRKNYDIVMWDVITYDFQARLDAAAVFNNVRKFAKSGSIIVFHDSIKAAPRMLDALKATLDHYSSEGFVFRSV